MESAAAMELKLYDFAESVCCQKIRLVVAEKGIAFREMPVPLDQGAQYEPAFLKLNPKGIVPVAVHGDNVITESTIINEYLEEVFDGPSLLPNDPYGRARSRYWSLQVDQGIHSPHTTLVSFVIALRYAFLQKLDTPEKIAGHLENVRDPVSREMQRQGFELAYDAPAFRAGIRAFDTLLKEMNDALAETPWLAGNEPSLGDFNLAPYIHRLDCLGLSGMWASREHVSTWYERLKQRPSWKSAIQEPHLEKWLDLMEMGGREGWPHVKKMLLI
jgi:glutathione S-transferase